MAQTSLNCSALMSLSVFGNSVLSNTVKIVSTNSGVMSGALKFCKANHNYRINMENQIKKQ